MEYTIIPMEIGAQERMDEYHLPMMMDDENIQGCLSCIMPPPYLDILVAHPSSFHGELSVAEGWDSTPGHFINLCIIYHLWEGENNIWLWSCRSGSNGIGQLLADITGVEVKAPLYTMYCGMDGFYFTTDISEQDVCELIENEQEKMFFTEEEQADKWVVLHPNDVLDNDEQVDFIESLEWLLSYLGIHLSLAQYCDNLSDEEGEDFSLDTVCSNRFMRRRLWASLVYIS